VLKLLKMAKSVRALLDTVMQALPEVGNLGLLFFLLFFIFAALGVELFGRIGQIADFILTSGQRVLTKGRIALPDCPFSRGCPGPQFPPNTWFVGPRLRPKWHLDRFSRFGTARVYAHTQTDHQTSATIGLIVACDAA